MPKHVVVLYVVNFYTYLHHSNKVVLDKYIHSSLVYIINHSQHSFYNFKLIDCRVKEDSVTRFEVLRVLLLCFGSSGMLTPLRLLSSDRHFEVS